jgi:hypothetical protein
MHSWREYAEGGLKVKVFTNDRGKARGVPMYSCLLDVNVRDLDAALRKVPPAFDAPNFAPAVAVAWLPDDEGKRWLAKHVGEGL